jgi:RND family efflux transporter MFP subunit
MDTGKPEEVQWPRRDGPDSAPVRGTRRHWLSLAIIAVLIVILIIAVLSRGHAHAVVPIDAPVTVAAVKVTRADVFNEISIPGEFRPYVEVELQAKVTGYLNHMNVDFGDRVKSNQLLATIEVPELGDELNSAIAVQERTKADYTNAHLYFQRLVKVSRQNSNLVAQQELDTAESKDSAASAAIYAAKADVAKYQTMLRYTRISAPFDGVVTHRYADPGALMQQSMPILRVSDNYLLRMDFPVSVKYVKDIRIGDMVDLKVDSLGGKAFTGKITRFTDRVNEETRTMMTEIEIPNPNLEIVPGMYAEVMLKVEEHQNVLVVPTMAAGGGNMTTVYVINGDDEIEARPIKLGLETPDEFEVTSGLKENELVMIGNRSMVHAGQKVDVKIVEQPVMQ